MNGKRLYRSSTNRMIAGVCGGWENFFTLIPPLSAWSGRLIGLTGTGIVAYIIAMIIIPSDL